jgi:hypothetical protein
VAIDSATLVSSFTLKRFCAFSGGLDHRNALAFLEDAPLALTAGFSLELEEDGLYRLALGVDEVHRVT